ncbi:MAG TPA: IcmT/TraK family protein [Aliidongia sp.]|uniref:IcmT/TraK family protein n=1 Tax=Aliidongia sp. TaxID=1914230 RepID=UPI002DDCA59F|nr:IcmT/TraK family protein [Aliidongia sp.]HEV2675561.1 IcmT/TraK family protein [Aliidongia sp.]
MWRDSGAPTRVLYLDGRACLAVLPAVVYWSWTTLYIAVFGVVFFTVISWFGLTVPALFRLLRRWLVGRLRPAVPVWRRRRLA